MLLKINQSNNNKKLINNHIKHILSNQLKLNNSNKIIWKILKNIKKIFNYKDKKKKKNIDYKKKGDKKKKNNRKN